MHRLEYKDYVQKITLLDIIVIAVVLIISMLLFFYSLKNVQGNNMQVKITSEEGTFVYPLHQNRDLVFKGPVGDTHIHIENNEVQVLDSPGRKKICVNAAPISKHGQWLACLPNRVFLRVFGADGEEVNMSEIDAMVF